MNFYLGTHRVNWLGLVKVPLFVSARRLRGRRTFPRATCRWSLDSGGFSELSMFGEWTITALRYAREVERWSREIGCMDWAAIQDWMCEPAILEKTGLTVLQHQARTINNYGDLLALAPDVPWVPVLQGWDHDDYLRHRDHYDAAGHDLAALPVVGLGSVCRRQATRMAEALVRELTADGIRLHGFGFKSDGLVRVADCLESADSLAWSFAARKSPPLPGHEVRHKNCANCLDFALAWRSRLMTKLARPRQGLLFPGAA